MKYLLDTHTFIWMDNDPEKLSARVQAICIDPENILLLSLASVWEMQIKIQLGKLTLPTSLQATLTSQIKLNHVELLQIKLSHILALSDLPQYHKDPFDRFLIAQALIEQIPLLTNDPFVKQYTVENIW